MYKGWTLLTLLLLLAGGSEARAESQIIEQGGIKMQLALDADAATRQVSPRITLTDSVTGAPVRGAHLLAWLSGPEPSLNTDAACTTRIKTLVQGGLSSRARADFNGFRLLSLTDRGELIALNPAVSLGGTQIEAATTFDSPVADMALDAAQKRLAIALQAGTLVRLLDPVTLKTIRDIELDASPSILRWQGERLAAVTEKQLVMILHDQRVATWPNPLKAAADTLVIGSNMAFLSAGRQAALLNLENGQAVHLGTLSAPITSATYSPLAQQFLVLQSGRVEAVDLQGGRHPQINIPALHSLAIAEQGRYWLGISHDRHQLFLFDGASGQSLASAKLTGDMDRITIGEHYAYVHSWSSDIADLINLAGFASGKLEMISVPVSEKEPVSARGRFERIALLPGGGAIIASPSGRNLAYYTEGMMAPMGSIPHYGRQTLGLIAIDNSLRESAPGVYQAQARYQTGGAMIFPVVLEQPRITRCFNVTLPVIAQSTPRLKQTLSLRMEPTAPQPQYLTQLILSAKTAPVDTAMRLLVRDEGSWQRRVHATFDRARGFVAGLHFPAPGLYHVTVEAPALGQYFGSQSFDIVVGAPQ